MYYLNKRKMKKNYLNKKIVERGYQIGEGKILKNN